MGAIFDKILEKTTKSVAKGRWLFKSLSGTEEERLEAEYVLGLHLAKEVISHIGIEKDSAQSNSVNKIGNKLSARLTDKRRKFHFITLNSEENNAFALPGGFIFATKSLIKLCEFNENEIAFALGHEMGHVIKGHALDRMIANSAFGLISNFGPGRGVVGQVSRRAISKLLYSSYSQDQELEADTFGVGIMDAARYEPHASVNFMKRLENASRKQNEPGIKKYFSSHPEYKMRIQNIQQTISRLN